MILPESLHPSMTRGGFTYRSLVPVRAHDIENFPQTLEKKLWLPLAAVSLGELLGARDAIEVVAARWKDAKTELARTALQNTDFDDISGCWQVDLDDSTHTEALWEIASHDMGGEVLNDRADKIKLCVCNNSECINPRHYDFTHRKKYRDTLMEVTPDDYIVLADGRVLPLWESDQSRALPAVVDSMQALIALQRRCPPYVDAKEAPLTANGISKITFEPTTGCWLSRMYYTRPQQDDDIKDFQYDSYGRMGPGRLLIDSGVRPAQGLAHRIVWQAVGNSLGKGTELNHMCAMRCCVNPSHLEETSKSENGLHAAQMRRYRQSISAS